MLNLLNTSVAEYLKDNVVLTVVLAIILALIVALSGIMIYLQVQAKKNGGTAETQEPQNEDREEPQEDAAEEPEAEKAEEDAASEEPKAEKTEEPEAEKSEEPVAAITTESDEKSEPTTEPEAEPKEEPAAEPEKEEKKPAKPAKTEPVVKLASNKKPPVNQKAVAKKSEEKKDDDKPVGFQDGKWVIQKTSEGKYTFNLYASNGSVMLESSKEYSSLSTAKQGIATYKKNFLENNCKIVSQKSGDFVYRLTNANGMLLAVSPSYTSKSSCENALENTKTYAQNAPIEVV